jgi:hypothetical protein
MVLTASVLSSIRSTKRCDDENPFSLISANKLSLVKYEDIAPIKKTPASTQISGTINSLVRIDFDFPK